MKLPSTLLLLCTSYSLAQSPPPNTPGQPPLPPGPPQGQQGQNRPGPGGPDNRSNRPFVDMMRQRMENRDKTGGGPSMDQLNEEDRKRLRTVMEKVWNSDDVKGARDAATDAAKKYRDVMHEAALKADPSLAPVLEKIKANMERMPMTGGFPQGPPGGIPGAPPNQPGRPGQGIGPNGPGPQGPPNGQPNGPPNPDAAPNPPPNPAPAAERRGEPNRPMVRGEGRGEPGNEGRGEGPGFRPFGIEPAELQKLPEAQRERLRGAFEKVMQNPDVKAARQALESAEGEGKRDAFRKMREAIKTVTEKEYPELAKMLETLRSNNSSGGPAAPGAPGGGNGENRRPERPERPPFDGSAPPPPPPTGQAPPPDSPGAPENAPPK